VVDDGVERAVVEPAPHVRLSELELLLDEEEVFLSNGVDLLDHVPDDLLVTGRLREAAFVDPPLREVHDVHELLELEVAILAEVVGLVDLELLEERPDRVVLLGRNPSVEVGVGEHDGDHRVGHVRGLVGIHCLVQDLQLQHQVLPVDGVLGGVLELEADGLELRGGRSQQVD